MKIFFPPLHRSGERFQTPAAPGDAKDQLPPTPSRWCEKAPVEKKTVTSNVDEDPHTHTRTSVCGVNEEVPELPDRRDLYQQSD